jgi:hypothetical protein
VAKQAPQPLKAERVKKAGGGGIVVAAAVDEIAATAIVVEPRVGK